MVDLDNDREDVSNCLKHLSQSPENPWVFNSNVRSDDLFKIEMAHGDAAKMKQMIDFQWAMVCILALSGAAGSPELLGGAGSRRDPSDAHESENNGTGFNHIRRRIFRARRWWFIRSSAYNSPSKPSPSKPSPTRSSPSKSSERKVEDQRPSLLSSFEIFRVSSINVCWFL